MYVGRRRLVAVLRIYKSANYTIAFERDLEDEYTVANQQTRISYRCPGFRPSIKNHESVPRSSASSGFGNDALSFVRRKPFEWVRRCRPTRRSSGTMSVPGREDAGGARKIVFSTFA